METNILAFGMALVLFVCCALLNLKTSSKLIAISGLIGVYASLGFMFFTLFKVAF